MIQPTEIVRRRSAPKAEETSDVTRFRGIAIASAIGAAAVLVAVVATGGVVRGPGPLSRPHVVAKLECQSCHEEERPSAACGKCHGAHTSTRPGHRDLQASGELECSTCHTIHRGNAGVAFLPDGRIIRYGPGVEEELVLGTGFASNKTVTVPIVAASACTGCHDLDSPHDLAAACLIDGQQELGRNRPTVCFDEHREVATGDTERDAAHEAARAVSLRAPLAPTSGGWSGPVGWLGMGLLASFVAFAAQRTIRRRKRAPSAPTRIVPSDVKRLPVIDTSTCIGCYACVDACPYDVLEVRRFVAVTVKADDCCGLTLCEQRCPNGSLVVTAGERLDDRPRVGETLESEDVPGIYIAGDLSGLPLIRNAINQGAHAVQHLASGLGDRKKSELDVLIVGAGPAGISAALEAKNAKLRYAVLEQGSAAESIRSFPRGKLVFDQPLGMPLVGDLWLEEASKEELLGKWLRIVRREKLDIREGQRVVAIDRRAGGPPAGGFVVRSVDADGIESRLESRRVVLAIGRRGSPRKLPIDIPEVLEDRVHYSLADARSFAGKRVVVVGLGDVAMETAVALSRQPGTEVTVSYRGPEFRRGKARNVDELRRAVAIGRLRLVLESEVRHLSDGELELSTPSGPTRVEWDSLFVMIGSIPPKEFLHSIGIGIG